MTSNYERSGKTALRYRGLDALHLLSELDCVTVSLIQQKMAVSGVLRILCELRVLFLRTLGLNIAEIGAEHQK